MKTFPSIPPILVPFNDQSNEGIFALFHNNCSESVFEKFFQISASSVDSSYAPKNAFFWNPSYFRSNDSQNSWILLQFVHFQVSMTGYRIIVLVKMMVLWDGTLRYLSIKIKGFVLMKKVMN
jgi:hypothetical protein